MRVLSPEWSTRRLTISNSTLAEIGEITEIFNSCHSVEDWDPSFYLVSNDETEGHINRSLDADEQANKVFRMQTIRATGTGQMVGYFHLMHGAPKPDQIWMSMFVVHPEFQGGGFGQEVAEGLIAELKKLQDYSAVLLEVYLKNWPALRFWIQSGFCRIVAQRGEKKHSSEAHASLVLERSLLD